MNRVGDDVRSLTLRFPGSWIPCAFAESWRLPVNSLVSLSPIGWEGRGEGDFGSWSAICCQRCARFLLANGEKSGHSCEMKIVEDICQHAAKHGLSEDEALRKGREEESNEVAKQGAQRYAKA